MLTEVVKCVLLDTLVAKSTQHADRKCVRPATPDVLLYGVPYLVFLLFEMSFGHL